jgi:hypothetical protein
LRRVVERLRLHELECEISSLGALENVLPNATRIEFPGLNHGASGNKNRGTKPERIARELRTFFAQDTQLGAGVGRSQTPQSHLPPSDPLGAGT